MVVYEWFSGELSFVPETTQVKHGDPALALTFRRPDSSPWAESLWFCFDIRVDQFSDANVTARFYDAGMKNHVDLDYQLLPNLQVSFRVQIDEIWSKRFFLPVFPGSYKGHCKGAPLDPKQIESVQILVKPGKDFKGASLSRVYVSEQEPSLIVPSAPMADEMGQLLGYDWPTKSHSMEEMRNRLETEYQEAIEYQENAFGLSAYGGYPSKRFEATGWFRTHQDGNRWWLVDPEGYAFFSHGLCYGTRMGEFGWFTGMEGFYTFPPNPEDALYKQAFTRPGVIAEYVKRHGITNRSNDLMINYARVNMMRVFGENWWEAWRTLAAYRFKKWGINTTGVGIVNFIDERLEDFLRLSQIPYAVTLKRFPTTDQFIFRDFPDVFAPEYKERSAVFARNELQPLAKDPYLIGYFLHNEPEWMFESGYCVAYELLVKEAPLHSRRHLMAWLKQKYGCIENLASAWGVELTAWEQLLSPLSRTLTLSLTAWEDLKTYEKILILAFGQIPLDACRQVDSNHLCLGLRHGGFTEKVIEGSAIFDVFSFNCYKHSPMEMLNMVCHVNKPVIIGEWHFGAQEIGLLRTSLQSCQTQEDRGKAYSNYLLEAASCPWCVGAHYFEYNDQSLLGRFDGEHMAHGIIDCTNRPYPAMAEAIARTSGMLYKVLTGETDASSQPVKYLGPHW